MESLLGVRRPLRDSSKAQSVLDKDAALARDDVPGTVVEREEEERLDAGIGSGGAFGIPMAQERAEGIERTVWEFRSEEMVEAEGMWYFVVMRVCLVSAEVYRGVGG